MKATENLRVGDKVRIAPLGVVGEIKRLHKSDPVLRGKPSAEVKYGTHTRFFPRFELSQLERIGNE